MFMSGGSSVAASNAARITPNSIVNAASIAAHIGIVDTAESAANRHAVDGLTKRPRWKMSRSARMLPQRRQGGSPPKYESLPRRDESAKAGFRSMISAKRAVAGQSADAASASMRVIQLRDAVDIFVCVDEGHVGFPNRSVSSCKNALLAAVRYAPLRSKTAAVRVGRGGSSGTGCRPSCTRAM